MMQNEKKNSSYGSTLRRHEAFQLSKVTIITDRMVDNCCETGVHWFALE